MTIAVRHQSLQGGFFYKEYILENFFEKIAVNFQNNSGLRSILFFVVPVFAVAVFFLIKKFKKV
jgi:hypothetical protein